MNNYKGVYKSFNGNDIIISYRKDDNTLTMVGMFDYNILNDANVEYVLLFDLLRLICLAIKRHFLVH